MKKRVQRILLIVLMTAIIVYTIINHINKNSDNASLFFTLALMSFFLISQIGALIREWNEE